MSLLLTLNLFHTFSSVCIADFEQVNVSWDFGNIDFGSHFLRLFSTPKVMINLQMSFLDNISKSLETFSKDENYTDDTY